MSRPLERGHNDMRPICLGLIERHGIAACCPKPPAASAVQQSAQYVIKYLISKACADRKVRNWRDSDLP